jgi:hypothetical protein
VLQRLPGDSRPRFLRSGLSIAASLLKPRDQSEDEDEDGEDEEEEEEVPSLLPSSLPLMGGRFRWALLTAMLMYVG